MTEQAGPQVIWQNSVDGGLYRITVTRISGYAARLYVVYQPDDQPILDREVGLAYQALFGPDADDVAQWQEMILAAIDDHYRERGEEPPA